MKILVKGHQKKKAVGSAASSEYCRHLGRTFSQLFLKIPLSSPVTLCVSPHSWLSILLMLAYMGTVIVILLNILIAQMSTTYAQAKRVARLEYDVDRILLLTRMERFPFLVRQIRERWGAGVVFAYPGVGGAMLRAPEGPLPFKRKKNDCRGEHKGESLFNRIHVVVKVG